MNGKTATLINKVSKISGVKSRSLKRLWNAIPTQHRYEVRQEWKNIIKSHAK